ncbi:MAG: flavodoxin domain-containing protein [Phycisphaerae bacterium]
MITQVVDGIQWVGVVDWGIKHFHGFELSTQRGTTYNAYIVQDQKTALVDSVWGPFTKEFLKNVREVVDPAEIDYVIANHAEPDHSGALPEVMKACPNATLIVSQNGAKSIPGHYHQSWDCQAVGTGDTIDIGSRKLVFVEAKMLHWPDSMFTYVTGSNVLMPNDAFGQHYATAYRFNDQVNQRELWEEAVKYYANILTPFSKLVLKKIDELVGMEVPVDVIAPSHGVIWRDDPMQIVRAYQEWAAQKPSRYAVVLYDTMWNATRQMAEAIGDGLRNAEVDYKLFHMAVSDRNNVITEIFQAGGLAIGSPTLNNGVLPTVAPILEDIKGLKFANKVTAAFGSYGWSGEGVKTIEQHLEDSKLPAAVEGVRAQWQPTEEDLAHCRRLGQEIGRKVTDAVEG